MVVGPITYVCELLTITVVEKVLMLRTEATDWIDRADWEERAAREDREE